MKVLFVDDEPRVLEGLERLLFSMDGDWEALFAGSGQAALDLLARERFDLVVTDMRMPGMDGATLLAHLQERHPHVMRVVLSGQTDEQAASRAVVLAHQFLSKPCRREELLQVLQRCARLGSMVGSPAVLELVGRLKALPAVPTLYAQVRRLVDDPRATPAQVADVLRQDPAMTARLLQLANSGFFSPVSQVVSPAVAVARLGLRAVSHMVLGASVMDQLAPGKVARVSALQQLGLARGAVAASLLPGPRQPECLAAGLLSPIGQLVLSCVDGEAQDAREALAAQTGRPLWEVEKEQLGANHAEVGAYLLAAWGIPAEAVEAVGAHRSPERLSRGAMGTTEALYVACCLLEHRPLDETWLREAGHADKKTMWEQRAAIAPLMAQEAA